MVKIESVKRGMASFLDSELMPKIPNTDPLKKFGAGVVIALAISGMDNVVKNLSQHRLVSMAGLSDGENVDLDALTNAISKNIPQEGVKMNLPMLGVITLDPEDVDKLTKRIMQAEAGEI